MSAAIALEARSIADARRALTAQLRAGGIDNPELDARLLVGHALQLDHTALAASAARRLTASEETAIAALAARRLGHEPVARIVGMKEFWGLQLAIGAATLVPRPETETVVEAALAAVAQRPTASRALRIADLGTGSGAILLALLTELPDAFGIGSDASPAALAVARANTRRLGITRAAYVACDMAAALRGPFDLIACNPPYIASREIDSLPRDVRMFDPRGALDGGPDGLNFYRAIASTVPALLAPDGVLVVELGAGQMEPVGCLFAAAGLALSPPRPDLNNVARALVAQKLQPDGHRARASDPGKKALGMSAGTD